MLRFSSPKGLLALKGWVIFALLSFWIVGLSLSGVFESVDGRLSGNGPPWILFGVLSLASVIATLILTVPRIRKQLVEESRAELYDPAPFFKLAVILATLAVIVVFEWW